MTVFWESWRISRSRMASNWRATSPTFCSSVRRGSPANFSAGTSAGGKGVWREATSISADDQFGLESAGLFHGFEDRHDIARGHAERVEGGGHFFDGRHFRQRDHRGFGFVHFGGGAGRHDGAAAFAEGSGLRGREGGGDAD